MKRTNEQSIKLLSINIFAELKSLEKYLMKDGYTDETEELINVRQSIANIQDLYDYAMNKKQ